MPSTLVHIGVQTPLTRAGLRGADLKWVLAGCLLPDLPWIGRRMASAVEPGLDPYHLMAYAHAQASLASCLILATALALLSRRPGRTWLVLAFGATLHLLLDSLEIKPGNGVHLLAPVAFTAGPIGADTMSLATLMEREERPGRAVSCDRAPFGTTTAPPTP